MRDLLLIERPHEGRGGGAGEGPNAELARLVVSPAPHIAIVCHHHSVRAPARDSRARHILQLRHNPRLKLNLSHNIMPKLPIPPPSPRVHIAVLGHNGAMGLSCGDAAHVLGVEGVREGEDRGGGVHAVRVPKAELPVLVLAPRVHLLLCRDREAVPVAHNNIPEDLVFGVLQPRNIRVATLVHNGGLYSRFEITLAQLTILVAPPREDGPVVRDAARVVLPARHHCNGIVVEGPIDGERGLQIRLCELPPPVTKLPVPGSPPGARAPDVALNDATLSLLHKDACFELVL
mmetsp:Transcript_35976/g.86896  ORF Transcript_35976/g.86896 Transcript_35976/m.86896 type:complete len:290 (-) Transcript_35976:1699-2568(-)